MAQGAGAAGGGLSFIIMMVAMFAIMYFMVIRPQRKRDKLTKEMLAGLIKGDKVITIGGIIGKIENIKDDELVLETGLLGNYSYVKVARWSVKEVLKPADE